MTQRVKLTYAFLFILLPICLIIGTSFGAFKIDFKQCVNILLNLFGVDNYSEFTNPQYNVLLHIRLPRVFLSMMIGAALAVSGAGLQGLFRNPLAVPGLIGISVGTILAFMAAYYGGWIDQVISTIVDVGLTIPGILILIVIAVNLQSGLTVPQMGLAVSAVAWVWPARTIRSQVLVMREQLYVEIARLSGTSGFSIMFKEMLPNLAPYIGASLVGSVASAILASPCG